MNFLKKLLSLFYNNEVHFINSSEKLKEPLTKDRELEELLKLRDGDPFSRDVLIEHNLRLVVYIAKKFENTGVMLDDLISIGTIGLIKAIKSFNVEKNIKLATYASRCIENEILMFLRKISKRKKEISFDDPLNVDWNGNKLLLSDILGTDEDIVTKDIELQSKRRILYEKIDSLETREREIMIRRFGLQGKKELTQKEVALLMGISQSYISRLEKKIIKKIKVSLQK